MVRIALVEDDANYRRELTEYLERFSKECGEHFAISSFTDGAEIAEGYTAGYDIILMDIAMSYMDGMSAAEAIRQVDDEVVIIFLTSMPQFAMKGYSVGALPLSGRTPISGWASILSPANIYISPFNSQKVLIPSLVSQFISS